MACPAPGFAWVASPALLKRMSDNLDWPALSRVKQVFSSGGALPVEASQSLYERLRQWPTEIFGSSETGGIAWRQGQSLWQPFAGVQLTQDNEGALLIASPYLPDGHTEHTADDARAAGGPLFGLQTWGALPTAHEETAPEFFHHPADTIPEDEGDGVSIRVVAGSCDGLTSPVRTFSDMLYADVALADGARYRITAEHIERAIYVITGAVEVEGQQGGFDAGELVILKPDVEIVLRARGPARIMLVGGEPLAEPRNIYWNFVSSSKDRIEQAKEDWIAQRFDKVPGETEFIPLPA